MCPNTSKTNNWFQKELLQAYEGFAQVDTDLI